MAWHGLNEQVHPSRWHNKEITAVSPVYEMRSIIYCTDEGERRERRGRHGNSIKTSRSRLPASERRSSHFRPL